MTARQKTWPIWQGSTVACLATGPSLTRWQVEVVRAVRQMAGEKLKVIAINDLGLPSRDPNAAWADIWYAADWKFWHAYQDEARASAALTITATRDALDHGVVDLFLNTKDDEQAQQYVPGYAVSGGHSGFQALQIAIAAGASRVLLVGYDCRDRGNDTNYFGRKPEKLDVDDRSNKSRWPKVYSQMKKPAGVEILNATPGSAISAFPFVDLAEALRCWY